MHHAYTHQIVSKEFFTSNHVSDGSSIYASSLLMRQGGVNVLHNLTTHGICQSESCCKCWKAYMQMPFALVHESDFHLKYKLLDRYSTEIASPHICCKDVQHFLYIVIFKQNECSVANTNVQLAFDTYTYSYICGIFLCGLVRKAYLTGVFSG